MSKILVPLNNKLSIKDFVNANVEEFYIGFYDTEFTNDLGKFAEINRMSGFEKHANPYSLEELKDIIATVRGYKKDIFVTINCASYSGEGLKRIEKYFEKLSSYNASGVIVSTPELVPLALKYNLTPVASTMCGIFNSDIVKFYKKLGCKRVILPRDLDLQEIEDIISSDSEMQYEVFLMRNGCQFSDNNCLGFHRREYGSICGCTNMAKKTIFSTRSDFNGKHETELNHQLYTKLFHKISACGLCAIYRFVTLGVTAFKIVGRAEFANSIINDSVIVSKNIEIAKSCKTEQEYLQRMIMPEDSMISCKLGLGCYYPEIRF